MNVTSRSAQTQRPPESAKPPAPAAPSRAATLAERPQKAETAPGQSSAYLGCGSPIPRAKLWDETSEPEVLEAIALAKSCAAQRGRHVLLEFVAPWCGDCREMARIEEASVVQRALGAGFERVRINVGKWDRHEALRVAYDVRALATYVVLDAKTSRVLSKTTLEPVTRAQGKQLTTDDWAAWLKQASPGPR